MAVPKVALGSQGFQVSAQGLGCMGMSGGYGPPKPEDEMIELIHKAVELGITMLDTSDAYGPHANEILVGKAVKGIREKVQICTKFGVGWDGNDHKSLSIRGDPGYVRSSCEGSLKRLNVDYIDLYYQHRIDDKVPIEITMGELKKLVDEGKIKYIGLSEASAADIRRAHAVHPITALQSEYSLWAREIEDEIIPTCREFGIGIVAYSPLGRGFFSGTNLADLTATDFRKGAPRFQKENFEKNKKFYEQLCELGAEMGCTPGQLALAWVQHKGTVPIPGTTKLKNLEENMGALQIKLTEHQIEDIQAAVPPEDVQGEQQSATQTRIGWKFRSSPPLDSWTSAL